MQPMTGTTHGTAPPTAADFDTAAHGTRAGFTDTSTARDATGWIAHGAETGIEGTQG